MFPSPTGMGQANFLQPQGTGWPAQHASTVSPWSAQPQMPQVGSQNKVSGFTTAGSNSLQPLQPQVTGNPFRQSMMFPQMTGGAAMFVSPSPPPQRAVSSPFEAKALSAQPTGSKNPFAPPTGSESKAAPSGPSLFDLSMQRAMGQSSPAPSGQAPTQPSAPQPQANNFMSELASAFNTGSGGNAVPDFMNLHVGNSSANDAASQSGFIQPQATGYAGSSIKPFQPTAAFLQPRSPAQLDNQHQHQFGTTSSAGLQPQQTGFAGSAVKPFKPSSTFGSSLVDSLPGQQGTASSSGPASPSAVQPAQTGFNPFALLGQPTGNSHGQSNGSSHSDFLQSLNAR